MPPIQAALAEYWVDHYLVGMGAPEEDSSVFASLARRHPSKGSEGILSGGGQSWGM